MEDLSQFDFDEDDEDDEDEEMGGTDAPNKKRKLKGDESK